MWRVRPGRAEFRDACSWGYIVVKIAVAGKGGVGKTTVCAGLVQSYAAAGNRVLAVDADPNNCLGEAIGFPPEVVERLTPISEMKELLAERAGTAEGGGFFALNPRVDDLLERYSVTQDGISLLVMGSVTEAGAGCTCPENAVLRALTRRLVEQPDMVVLLDMEAGIEHLGRGTARHVDLLLVVTEPTQASLNTVRRIARLAGQLRIPRCGVVGNKIAGDEAARFVRKQVGDVPVIGLLPFDHRLGLVDFQAGAPGPDDSFSREIERMRDAIAELVQKGV